MSKYSISDALAHRNAPLPEPPEPPDSRRTRRKRMIGATLAVGLIGVSAVAVWAVRSGESDDIAGFGNPNTVDLPPLPSTRGEVSEYLRRGGGQILRDVHLVSRRLEAADSPADCVALADDLDALATPREVFAIGDGVPDAATREILLSHLDEMTRYIGDCLRTGQLSDAGALRFKRVVAERRLEEFE